MCPHQPGSDAQPDGFVQPLPVHAVQLPDGSLTPASYEAPISQEVALNAERPPSREESRIDTPREILLNVAIWLVLCAWLIPLMPAGRLVPLGAALAGVLTFVVRAAIIAMTMGGESLLRRRRA